MTLKIKRQWVTEPMASDGSIEDSSSGKLLEERERETYILRRYDRVGECIRIRDVRTENDSV